MMRHFNANQRHSSTERWELSTQSMLSLQEHAEELALTHLHADTQHFISRELVFHHTLTDKHMPVHHLGELGKQDDCVRFYFLSIMYSDMFYQSVFTLFKPNLNF